MPFTKVRTAVVKVPPKGWLPHRSVAGNKKDSFGYADHPVAK